MLPGSNAQQVITKDATYVDYHMPCEIKCNLRFFTGIAIDEVIIHSAEHAASHILKGVGGFVVRAGGAASAAGVVAATWQNRHCMDECAEKGGTCKPSVGPQKPPRFSDNFR
jgi:hypothetical protein